MSARVLMACMLLLPATAWAQAQLRTYVEQPGGGANEIALGYPVPRPIASLTPVDGFREYASLLARLQALALASPDLSAHPVGATHAGRQVWAFRVSSPGDLRPDGRPKPAFVFNVTTHAREWQAPEVGAGLIEHMVARADSDPWVRFVLDHAVLVILPVQNVDGFLQTQRYPDQVLVGMDVINPPVWPRDGRMRRKNMLGVDEDLLTQGDHLFGVDLNRNHPPYWNTDAERSSSDTRSLVHHGQAPHSEPENQALLNAIQMLVPAGGGVRLGVDVHSFTAVFFSANVAGRPRLFDIQTRLLSRLANHHREITRSDAFPNGIVYQDVPAIPGRGIGTADEYFAATFLVPAWTLEIEPNSLAGRMYGGIGVSHDGFIMPAWRIRAVREAWAESHQLAFYAMAGPPHLEALRVVDRASGEVRVDRRWRDSGSASRVLHVQRALPLLAGRGYRLDLQFSKPMRWRQGGQVKPYPGQFLALDPGVFMREGNAEFHLVLDNRRWQKAAAFRGRYADDTWSADFETPEALPGAQATVSIEARDMVGDHLDADPATVVGFSEGAWSSYEDSFGVAGDQGGTDTQHAVSGADQEPAEPILAAANDRLLEGGVLHLPFERRRADARAVSVTVDAAWPGLRIEPSLLSWAAHETGTRMVRVRLAEDSALGDVPLVLSGDLADAQAEPRLVLIGNDDANLRRVVVDGVHAPAATQLQAALASAGVGERVDVLIEAGVDIDLAAIAATALPAVVGDVRILGQDNRLRIAGAARFFEVAAGGRLQLEGLRLVGGRGDDGGQILNRGELVLSRVRLEGGQATRGAAVWNDGGDVRVRRSLIRQAVGEGAVAGSGHFDIAASTFSDNEGEQAAALEVAGTVDLRSVSLVGNRARHPVLRLLAGSASFDHVLIAGNQVHAGGAACSVAPASVLHSLADAAGCGLAAAQVLTAPLAGAFDERLGGYLPLAVARGRGGAACGGDDQSGAPRPFAGACDPGALEASLLPFRGLWIPDRPGHGIDLHLIGNVLFVLWYTYAEDGTPVAYTSQGAFDAPVYEGPLLAHRRHADGSMQVEEVGSLGLDFGNAGEVSPDRARLAWRFHGGDEGEEGVQAFVYAEGTPRFEATGAFADLAELGYGFTIGTRGDVLVAVLYYYDAEGLLRWVLGSGPYDSAARLQMMSYTGFCPNCDAATHPSLPTPAGEVLLDVLTPDRLRVSTRVSYPGGGDWVRNTTIVPLNPPVDNTLMRVP